VIYAEKKNKESDLKCFLNIDICAICQLTIINKVIEGKLLDLGAIIAMAQAQLK